MNNLQLSLITKWFNLTKEGVKLEDYREITPYWCKRLLLYNNKKLKHSLEDSDIDELCRDLNMCCSEEGLEYQFDNWYLSFKKFDYNIMTLGYPKSTDTERILKFEHKGIEINTGNPDWGAEPNKLYFIIKHGKKNLT